MTPDTARDLAISGLQYLAGDEEHLSRFVALTGISLDEIREQAGSDAFLVGVLDYFLGNEPTLIAFAANESFAPEDVQTAKFTLAPEEFSDI